MIADTQTGRLNGDLVRSLLEDLPTSESGWPPRPFQIVSLAYMEKFIARDLYIMMSLFYATQFNLSPDTEEVSAEDQQSNKGLIPLTIAEIERFKLSESLKYARRLGDYLERGGYTYGDYQSRVAILRERIDDELRDITFMFIPKCEVKFYENKSLFGENVKAKFPSGLDDIKEAGSCFATGRATACVFHSMRVVEHGLRALAKDLRVKLPKKRHIDLEDWGGLIDAIEGKIATIERTKRRTKQRETDLQFYHGAAAQFRHFKNAWRNHVMHSRVTYELEDAGIVLRHVDEFMQHLATRLKE